MERGSALIAGQRSGKRRFEGRGFRFERSEMGGRRVRKVRGMGEGRYDICAFWAGKSLLIASKWYWVLKPMKKNKSQKLGMAIVEWQKSS